MHYVDLGSAVRRSVHALLDRGIVVDPGRWQGVPTTGHPEMVTRELIGWELSAEVPKTVEELQNAVRPNLPWAENHFLERVAGVPTNPGEQYLRWPHWRSQDRDTMTDGKFTHTYQERFWPKTLGGGIRFPLGDLEDVISLLRSTPYTRQAYLPVMFPEDTGAVHGGRIPCSIGYGFLRRSCPPGPDALHTFYTIRSVDAYRHFKDDVYLAARLCQHVVERCGWTDCRPGILRVLMFSFHVHRADERALAKEFPR